MPVQTRSQSTSTPTSTSTPATINTNTNTDPNPNPKTWLSGYQTVNDVLPFSSPSQLVIAKTSHKDPRTGQARASTPRQGRNVSLSAVGLRGMNGRLRREGLRLRGVNGKGVRAVNEGFAATTAATTTVQRFEGVIEYEVVEVGSGFEAALGGDEGARMARAELYSRLAAGAEEDKAERVVEMEVEAERERKKRERKEREREKKRVERKRKREDEENEERRKKGPRLGMFYES